MERYKQKIVQIKGSNGSGKTTIVKQLLELSANPSVITLPRAPYPLATVMDDIGWIALGSYPATSKMGGCDNMKSIAEIKCALDCVMDMYPQYYVVFEGMMISTIKSTFYEYLQAIRLVKCDPPIQPIYVILRTTGAACVERLMKRGTARPGLNHENVASKCEMILRHAGSYNQRYVRYMDVDDIKHSDMLRAFLEAVDDKELLATL